MPIIVARAIGIDPYKLPRDAQMSRLFEARRADNGQPWSPHRRKLSGFDLVFSPHKSVSLAAEFAATPAESAAIWNALDPGERRGDALCRSRPQPGASGARRRGRVRSGRHRLDQLPPSHGAPDAADPGRARWTDLPVRRAARRRPAHARPQFPLQPRGHRRGPYRIARHKGAHRNARQRIWSLFSGDIGRRAAAASA
jgi:TrwC relaxase